MLSSNVKVGVLGGGQLGRMFAEPANRLNIHVSFLDAENSPAKQITAHNGHIVGSFNDPKSVKEAAESVDVLTAEIEHVDTHSLEEVASRVKIEPHWQTFRTIQDKFLQKQFLSNFNIPMAGYIELVDNSLKELTAIGEKLGFPFMLKSKTQAYDGRGNYVVRDIRDFPTAIKALEPRPLFAEKWANFKMEVAVIVVKTQDGVLSYPTVETVQEDSICKLVYAPARNVSESVNKQAQELAKKVVAAFDGLGVFGVEMFLLEDDTLLLCEVACRVHNSGHYTIEACGISQFEAHLRSILCLPIPAESLQIRQPAVMLNILGGAKPDSHFKVAERALSVRNASIHLYGKGAGRPGRKMGHITVTAPTIHEAETLIQPLVEYADSLSINPKGKSITTSKPKPTIGVIMGSDSDLKTLIPGLKLLKEFFGIQPEVEITSAHRTPEYMAEYASTAASRGIKVIIAAAGGAAHLPGMSAAFTTLPVIGVPVKASALDGVDSLYSIVQMPRGVPVATVGINNSINAALLAMRILGAFDPSLQRKVEEYAEIAKKENLDLKGIKLKDIGWEEYYKQIQENK